MLIESGIPMKLIRLLKMCLHETYNRIRIDKHLSEKFSIRNGLKQGDVLLSLLFNYALMHTIKRVQVDQDRLKLNGSCW